MFLDQKTRKKHCLKRCYVRYSNQAAFVGTNRHTTTVAHIKIHSEIDKLVLKMDCHHFYFLCGRSNRLAKWMLVVFFGCLVIWLVTIKDKHNRVTSAECGNDPVDYLTRSNFLLTEKSVLVTRYDSKKNHHAPCRSSAVHQFTLEETVRCFDSLSVQRQRRPMHIAFIGDSTVRQHFLNLLEVLLTYMVFKLNPN